MVLSLHQLLNIDLSGSTLYDLTVVALAPDFHICQTQFVWIDFISLWWKLEYIYKLSNLV